MVTIFRIIGKYARCENDLWFGIPKIHPDFGKVGFEYEIINKK